MGIIALLSGVGSFVRSTYPGKLLILTFTIIGSVFVRQGNRRASFSTLIAQIYFTGVEAVPHVGLLAVVVGAITILQAVTVMPKLGGGDALGDVMVAVVFRELGPLITALFIAGRTGSAMSTYIANMKVLQEIDALKTMGINPVYFQIMPSFFATLISLYALTMIFNLAALLGGYFIVWMMLLLFPGMFSASLSLSIFVDKVFTSMTMVDTGLSVVKPLIFGAFISVIACYHGLNVGNDVREVPKATRMTVVRSFVFILLFDLVLGIPVLMQIREKMVL